LTVEPLLQSDFVEVFLDIEEYGGESGREPGSDLVKELENIIGEV
jgi:hypothetical protein